MGYEVFEGVNFIDSITVNPDIYKRIIEELEIRTNLKFKYYQKNYVIKRIKSRIKSRDLPSDKAYYNYLKTHPKEIDHFLDNFTITYSYFFRNYRVFEDLLELIEDRGLLEQNKVRIWSCPCASGEEPYSLAILFEEVKEQNNKFPTYEIVASDINSNAIADAKIGIYGTHALSDTSKGFKNKYFNRISESPPKYKIGKKIRRRVEFINEDITLGHEKSQKYDIILCRNFMIYINDIYRKELLRNLKNQLERHGVLVLGKTESIKNDPSLKLIDPINQFYIQDTPNIFDARKPTLTTRIKKTENVSQIEKSTKDKGVELKKKLTQRRKEKIQKLKETQPDSDKEKKFHSENKKRKSLKKSSKEPKVKKIEKPPKRSKSPSSQTQKEVISLKELNKKLKKDQIRPEFDLSDKTKESHLDNKKENLEKLREKIKKEYSSLHIQRKALQEKISKFQKIQDQFKQEKKRFNRKKHLFEQEVTQYKRELDWFRSQKEQFERRVNRFEREREQFLKKKKQFLSHNENYPISSKESQKKSKKLEEYILSLGKFIILSYKRDDNDIDVLSFYGLGSSYGLILIDPIRKVCCMSHILFAKPKEAKKRSQIDNSHQYASLCVPYLLKKMLLKGASEKNISAMILGGAQIFNKNYKSIKEIYTILKNELAYYNINIEKTDIGGQTQRAIKYNLKEKELYLKYKGEEKFTKL
mgnify:CR=1 FL=1